MRCAILQTQEQSRTEFTVVQWSRPSHSGSSAEAHWLQPWDESRKLDLTPVRIVTYVPQAQKWSVGRAVRQPSPESGDAD